MHTLFIVLRKTSWLPCSSCVVSDRFFVLCLCSCWWVRQDTNFAPPRWSPVAKQWPDPHPSTTLHLFLVLLIDFPRCWFSNLSLKLMRSAALLNKDLLSGDLALFIGAGASAGAGVPSWATLLRNVALEAGMTAAEVDMCLKLPCLDQAKVMSLRLGSTGALAEAIAAQINKVLRFSLQHALLVQLETQVHVSVVVAGCAFCHHCSTGWLRIWAEVFHSWSCTCDPGPSLPHPQMGRGVELGA